MSLNIKDEHVHEQVREAARLTGKSQKGVVAQAVDDYLARLHAEDERLVRRRRLQALFDEWDRNPITEEERQAMTFTEESLYDPDTGLPA